MAKIPVSQLHHMKGSFCFGNLRYQVPTQGLNKKQSNWKVSSTSFWKKALPKDVRPTNMEIRKRDNVSRLTRMREDDQTADITIQASQVHFSFCEQLFEFAQRIM
jgi:hypothetical protein